MREEDMETTLQAGHATTQLTSGESCMELETSFAFALYIFGKVSV